MVKTSYYTTQEIADRLQISKKTLYRWESAGKIPKAKRDPHNRYRKYTNEDIKFIEKLSREGRMNWTKNIVSWIVAKDISPELWKMLKSQYPARYKKLQRDIEAWGIDKVKIGFNEILRPEKLTLTL